MTSKYPDIALVVPRATAEGVDSFIIDAEAVAMDRATGEIRPFQVLSTRKRKDATVDNITVQVCVFAFDLLYLNGEPLLREQFARRRELLHKTFNPIPKELEVRAVHSPALQRLVPPRPCAPHAHPTARLRPPSLRVRATCRMRTASPSGLGSRSRATARA